MNYAMKLKQATKFSIVFQMLQQRFYGAIWFRHQPLSWLDQFFLLKYNFMLSVGQYPRMNSSNFVNLKQKR